MYRKLFIRSPQSPNRNLEGIELDQLQAQGKLGGNTR